MRLKIDGIEFQYFVVNNLSLKFDAIASTFAITVPFDPYNINHISIFRPLRYKRIQIFDENNIILTGVILSHKFQGNAEKSEVAISGYSLPGILNDCDLPVSSYPLQVKNKSIAEIAKNICDIFGLELVIGADGLNSGGSSNSSSNSKKNTTDNIDPWYVYKGPYIYEPNAFFKKLSDSSVQDDPSINISTSENIEKSMPEPDEQIGSYLSKICANKNIILSHTTTGALLLTKPNVYKKPSGFIQETDPILTDISLDINGQNMHRSISILSQAETGVSDSGQDIILNPLLDSSSKRNSVKIKKSGDSKEQAETTKRLLASQLENIKVNCEISGWSINGRIPLPGSIYSVNSPKVFLFQNTNLFLSEISMKEDKDGRSASISFVLPESFTGENIQNIFEKVNQTKK